MKRKMLKIGLPLCVVSALTFAAYLWFGQTISARQKLAETVKQDERVFEQYFNADYDTAKEAMLNHIRLLDRLSTESERPTRNPYAVDAMSWSVRLANLEAKNHRSGEAEYLQDACSRCEKLKWADCSQEKLRAEVERMDKIAFSQLKKN
jgi:hypothetical protein